LKPISASSESQDQIMPLLAVSIMSQLVFSGGMIWVTDRILLDQVSWGTPARWGYAASASTINVDKLVPGPTSPKDQHWAHKPSAWPFDKAMLAVPTRNLRPCPTFPVAGSSRRGATGQEMPPRAGKVYAEAWLTDRRREFDRELCSPAAAVE
jgi:hypothetical protein